MKSSGVLYWYDIGNNPLAETDTSGNTIDKYVFFQGRRIARRDSSGNVDYYISDHLGTARVVTNSTGTILDDCDLYPYGGERCVSTSSGNHYIFTGKERDTESGLDYFIARHYAGSMGRFMSPDQFPGGIVDAFTGVSVAPPGPVPYADIFDPQTLNKYGYVRDNPLRYIDPDGHHNQGNHEANGDCTKHTKNVAQNTNAPKTGFWSGLGQRFSNLIHGQGFVTNMGLNTSVTVEQGPMNVREPNSKIAAAADAAGVVATVIDNAKLGAASAVVIVVNDPSLKNIAITGIGLIPGPDVPIAFGSAAIDGSNFVTNQILAPMFNAAPTQNIDDGNGHMIPNPALRDERDDLQ